MTTTAATANTSASTPKDSSSRLHDYQEDGASETIGSEHRRHRDQQEHNHVDQQRNNNSNSGRTPSPSSQGHQPDSPMDQSQSPDNNDVSNTTTSTPTASAKASPSSPPTTTQITPTTTTSSLTTTSPTTTISSAPATVNDKQHLEQSTSSQQQHLQQSTTNNSSNSNGNTEQKRPMNAFLLFCKRQRSLVKEKYPNLENRGITKILGDWWSKLDKEQKSKYTDMARQHKEAFMKANPDFKWCKAANVSNINNNISMNIADNDSSCNNLNNTNSHQQQQHLQQNRNQHLQRLQPNNYHSASVMKTDALSLQSTHNHHHQPMDVVHHSSNSMDIMLRGRKQLEAPKPPKKRFLERNDSVYTTKSSSLTPNHNDTNSLGTDVVPYISLDQDFLDRVIDKAFSEDSSSSPSGKNTCKFSNRIPTNLTTTTSGNNPTSLSSSSTTAYTTASSTENNDEQPMDYSMKKTYMATSQQIINSLVENMLSEPTDNNSSFSKMNGTDSVRSQIRPPVKRDNPNDT